MKIGNNLRNLVMRQSQTYMLSRSKAEYLGEIYTFNPVTSDEVQAFIQRTVERISPPIFINNLKKLLVSQQKENEKE